MPKPFYILLNEMNVYELNRVLKNIKLGKEHLRAYLDPQAFKELLEQASLTKEQRDHLQADREEKAGHSTRNIMTILTSFLGLWMGLSDLIYGGERNLWQFIIILALSLLLGGLIGILSYRSIANKAKESIVDQKLINLQLRLVKKLLQKSKLQLKKLESKLNKIIASLYKERKANSVINWSEEFASPDQQAELVTWLWRDIIENKLTDLPALHKKLPLFINTTLVAVERLFKKRRADKPGHTPAPLQNHSYEGLSILMSADLTPPQQPIKIIRWILKDLRNILVGLLPTLLGTFASLFVFINGMPDVLKKTHLQSLGYEGEIHLPDWFWVSVAVFVSLYLAVSYLKALYKDYVRRKNIEATQKIQLKLELKLSAKNRYYRLSVRLLNELKKISLFYASYHSLMGEAK